MAMACGLAPICTKFAYATWALQEDRGMLVNLQEFANLAVAFQKMLQDQNLRNLYALNAKAFANNMSWAVVARKFLTMDKVTCSGNKLRLPRNPRKSPKFLK
ncbi:hypothetical protein CYMTET_4343 [Cymbomonas tetramitiformis]|uniref:Uncharacterized protein n=1 Tax=Cymbomonas tetramitiformis TaxID=36881 RepID=A0AAE0H1A7_9CHLO|nr:hypothetical protein CYMTET_4343 [Cymbomonas tetramitiformis]